MRPLDKAVLMTALAAIVAAPAAQAASQTAFPTRPIRMIAPASSGGPVDVMARVFAPVSPAIVTRLHAATVKTLTTPAVKAAYDRQGVETVGSTPEEFAKWMREEWAKWQKVVKAAGLKAGS